MPANKTYSISALGACLAMESPCFFHSSDLFDPWTKVKISCRLSKNFLIREVLLYESLQLLPFKIRSQSATGQLRDFFCFLQLHTGLCCFYGAQRFAKIKQLGESLKKHSDSEFPFLIQKVLKNENWRAHRERLFQRVLSKRILRNLIWKTLEYPKFGGLLTEE